MQDRQSAGSAVQLLVELCEPELVRVISSDSPLSEEIARLLARGYRTYLAITSGCAESPDRADGQHSARGDVSSQEYPAEADRGLPPRPSSDSVVSYLQRLRRERGAVSFMPREWARVVDATVGEIELAITHGALEVTIRQSGRGHGARLVRVESLLAYVALRDAVQRGTIAPPIWWAAVRQGRVAA